MDGRESGSMSKKRSSLLDVDVDVIEPPSTPSPAKPNPTTCNSHNHDIQPTRVNYFELKIDVEEGFDLEKAVCNFGFFMTAPNNWIPDKQHKCFHRPLRLSNASSSVTVTISQTTTANHHHLLVRVHDVTSLSSHDERVILEQVGRMLRISSKNDEDMREFHRIHVGAKRTGFGRLFRSPDLFEDIIKAILLCNASWDRTLQMCRALCEVQGEGNFPSSKEIAGLDKEMLENRCKLGYRAESILQVAQRVEDGKIRLKELDQDHVFNTSSCINIYNKLTKLEGIGAFAATTIFLCIGIYHKIPIDSETIAHMEKAHRKKLYRKTTAERERVISQVYKKFAPYQGLAYWYELTRSYEKKIGQKLSELSPLNYRTASSSFGARKKKRG